MSNLPGDIWLNKQEIYHKGTKTQRKARFKNSVALCLCSSITFDRRGLAWFWGERIL